MKAQHRPSPVRRTLDDDEVDLLCEIAQGKTNMQLANKRYVAEDTIKTRLRQLYRLLGANSRAHAVAIGYHRGVLSGAPGGRGETRRIEPEGGS